MFKQKKIVFDLETKLGFDEINSREDIPQMGVSVAVVYNYASRDFSTYFEEEIPQLIEALFKADLVIGFNIKRFDYRVLSRYTEVDFTQLPTLDILEDIEKVLGFRIKLDNLVKTTLGQGKSADGKMAVKWYRAGKIDKVARYCQEDVRLTKELYEYGCKWGKIWHTDKNGTRRSIFVKWMVAV
ncbi:MAG: ribonuclease H-like domain-containing protein [Candidatus Desantisbacteria bacterium]